MKTEIIEKKLEQIKVLLKELKGLLAKPFSISAKKSGRMYSASPIKRWLTCSNSSYPV